MQTEGVSETESDDTVSDESDNVFFLSSVLFFTPLSKSYYFNLLKKHEQNKNIIQNTIQNRIQ